MDNMENDDVLILRKTNEKSNSKNTANYNILIAVVICMFLSVSINTYIYLDIRTKIENIDNNNKIVTKQNETNKSREQIEKNSSSYGNNEMNGLESDGTKTYRVSSGETLSIIAEKNKLSLIDLERWNQLENDVIYDGQILKIHE